ncbi:MAG: hypothetical protein JW765_05145 [Deltaproteobacteria bacterium]|nr:hypothetical protein [Candidatus Zymogenaceae bacterium]
MDYKEKAFRDKFYAASRCLGVPVERIISLKVRENVGAYHEYKELLHELDREAGITHSPIAGDFQGKAHLVGNDRTKIIVVEHETGLEIISILADYASIISLEFSVLMLWREIRGNTYRHHRHDSQNIEIRRVDKSGHFIEGPVRDTEFSSSKNSSIMNQSLLAAIGNIDSEIKKLEAAVSSLTERMSAIEGKLVEKKSRRPAESKKKSAKKTSKR